MMTRDIGGHGDGGGMLPAVDRDSARGEWPAGQTHSHDQRAGRDAPLVGAYAELVAAEGQTKSAAAPALQTTLGPLDQMRVFLDLRTYECVIITDPENTYAEMLLTRWVVH